ncbi:MAG: cytochrome c, class I [Burkholderiales bacterium RIFOXYD2_FULL_59_8]|nr:MAG: cytochrome c, class I [Burkholderiales bacterium RIFOXYD12_FULL_59_19]OGB68219.1 MAG: cytochrome c, class I [Burkholderiales bacterium RIFOXYC12_FULL_60_6]OGB84617.1 MAG: cytochrome c, class I [Burkholderiales bacterium RIFOXYD2_FULL_59_8]
MRIKKALTASALVLVMGSAWAQADQARAEKIVSGSCFLCHGESGESSSEIFPKLAGQHANYIAKQLENFKSGIRKSTAMADMSSRLSADDMLALGQYFESKPVEPEVVKDTDLAAVGRYLFNSGNKYSGVPACASCHGKDGLGSANLPRLAGQYASYIETQLTLFNQRERTNDNAVMHAIVSKMTPLEMAAVATYISGK